MENEMTAIVIKQGNDFSVVRYVTENGNAVDLTGDTVTCEVRAMTADTVLLTPTATVTNAATGEVTLSATAVDTDAMAIGSYLYDIKRVNGATVRNTDSAKFTVQGPITE